MPRAPLFTALNTALASALVLAGPVYAQPAQTSLTTPAAVPGAAAARTAGGAIPETGLWDVPLPGGLNAALAALDDHTTPDRSQFLLEVIRRTHHLPAPRSTLLGPLLAHLDAAGGVADAGAPRDMLPMPLPPDLWITVVLGGRATEATLVAETLRSRGASLLYAGLLSLDVETRAWLATEPALLAELAGRPAAAFLLAAPGLRVAGGRVRVPGGEDAERGWEALAGRRVTEPAAFTRALVVQNEGRLAYPFGALAQLTAPQLRVALDLDAGDKRDRVSGVRRIHDVFIRVAGDWKVEGRTFWRPALDPALLAAELPVDAAGRPIVPGTQAFWRAAFDRGKRGGGDRRKLNEGGPATLPWLCEQIFAGADHRRRYEQVLFASRIEAPLATEDALAAVRAAGRYPALVAAIERIPLRDPAVIAGAARRAAQLTAIGDETRAARAIAQFQGLLAVITRAASRGSLPGSPRDLVTSLVAIAPTDRGDYEGQLVKWLDAHLRPGPGAAPLAASAGGAAPEPGDVLAHAPLDQELLGLLAGPSPPDPHVVDWEGTRYRIDLSHAELTRIRRLLGEEARPYVSAAHALTRLADAVSDAGLAPGAGAAGLVAQVAEAVQWKDGAGWSSATLDRYRSTLADLERAGARTPAALPRLGEALRLLADDLLARGLVEIAYATALGQPERTWIAAGEAAVGHDFGLSATGPRGRDTAWRLPEAGADTHRDWRARGSILGLDVRLAELSLVRLSAKLPPRKPTLTEEERRVFVENVALVTPAALTDAARARLVSLVEAGRTRLAAVRNPSEAAALAAAIRLGPARRSLLPWVVARDPARTMAFLSPIELLWLGLDGQPLDDRLHAWGAPAASRLGCLCLRMIEPRPWETLAGRWGTGIFASGFPDLNLRLSELLAALHMPAVLLGPVLTSATLDFVNSASSRSQDDRRGLVDFVQTLTPERVEQYLALLTTDGPLVPVGEAASAVANKTEGPR